MIFCSYIYGHQGMWSVMRGLVCKVAAQVILQRTYKFVNSMLHCWLYVLQLDGSMLYHWLSSYLYMRALNLVDTV